MGKLYVGIDISKDKSSANGIDDHGKSRFEISFNMDGTGFAELLKAIEANSESNEGVVAAMESTVHPGGTYRSGSHIYCNGKPSKGANPFRED